jgi:hypothetical protein
VIQDGRHFEISAVPGPRGDSESGIKIAAAASSPSSLLTRSFARLTSSECIHRPRPLHDDRRRAEQRLRLVQNPGLRIRRLTSVVRAAPAEGTTLRRPNPPNFESTGVRGIGQGHITVRPTWRYPATPPAGPAAAPRDSASSGEGFRRRRDSAGAAPPRGRLTVP